MSFYSKLAETALTLLARFGQDVTRIAVTTAAYDPATGNAAETTVMGTRTGVLLSFADNLTHINGAQIEKTDKQLLLDAVGPVEISDRYQVGTELYTVVSIDPVSPAGVVVLNQLHLRK